MAPETQTPPPLPAPDAPLPPLADGKQRVAICGDCWVALEPQGATTFNDPHMSARPCDAHVGYAPGATRMADVPKDALAAWCQTQRDVRNSLQASAAAGATINAGNWGGQAVYIDSDAFDVGRAPTRISQTEIAMRLLVAWSSSEAGATADSLMVQHAANVAAMLLAHTQGR